MEEPSYLNTDSSSYMEGDYSTWRYADEASLYSIAEDSREDREACEITSRAGPDVGNIGPKVEIQWTDHGMGETDVESHLSDEEMIQYDQYAHNSRRCKLLAGALLLAVLIVSVSLGVALSRPKGQPAAQSGSQTTGSGSGVDVGTGNGSQTNSSDSFGSGSIVEGPTPAPSSTSKRVVRSFVWDSVASCTEFTAISAPSTYQYAAFEQLVKEITTASRVNSDGTIVIPTSIGQDEVAERFAMLMFFMSALGSSWTYNFQWMSSQDTCKWYGVESCNTRASGSCAVTSINLGAYQRISCGGPCDVSLTSYDICRRSDSNNVGGNIPDEICCLRCLQTLSLANNLLTGKIPTCLSSVNLDLSNNYYTLQSKQGSN